MISSSTDDGTPIHCGVCGATSLVNASRPPGDAVCPSCGAFLWVNTMVEITKEYSFDTDVRLPSIAATIRDDAIREMTAASANEYGWTKAQQEELNFAIIKRDGLGTTGIGRGFAVPHASIDWLTKCTTAIECSDWNRLRFT